ncbi:hypothetical protein ACFFYR_07170 [Paraburkholderia dipogonis]|uniref:hypothetical protein n=1 Tax=Paraburkholderia dipogonis TaxID=1211383 RepID=UPI0035EA3911
MPKAISFGASKWSEHACSIGTWCRQGEFAENVAGGVDTYTLRQPIGVCAG